MGDGIMTGLGAMMSGGNPVEARQRDDFYSTPAECTAALLRAEGDTVPPVIWEPACGTGAISKVVEESGRTVISADLVDRGYGNAGADFLLQPQPPQGFKKIGIITNPPFKLAEPFIRHAYDMLESREIDYFALLLKATFFHAARRRALFDECQPSRIYAMSWRPDFRNLGAPTMDCIWCVWDFGGAGTDYQILGRGE